MLIFVTHQIYLQGFANVPKGDIVPAIHGTQRVVRFKHMPRALHFAERFFRPMDISLR